MITVKLHLSDRGPLSPLFHLADDSESQVSKYLPLGEVLVARDDDLLVGHVQLLETGMTGEREIRSLAVREDRQREGIGARLVQAAVDRCVRLDVSRIILATATADIENLRFYQRQGFRMFRIVQDAFDPSGGYPADLRVGGIALRDQVWFERKLSTGTSHVTPP